MDIVARAEQRREELRQELARIEQFLATAFELQRDLSASIRRDDRSDGQKADAPKRLATQNPNARGGIGALTVEAAVNAVRERGPLATRDLLPLVVGRGIEVGGRDPIATLSARLSNKGPLKMIHGKWHEIKYSAEGKADEEEATDNPAKVSSAASLFHTTQGEQLDAAALVS